MDGIASVWMTLSKLGKRSQFGLLGLGFAAGFIGLGSLHIKVYCVGSSNVSKYFTPHSMHLRRQEWVNGCGYPQITIVILS